MAVVNASNFVSRRDVLRAPWAGGGDLQLPFMPAVAAFSDGSALVLGGWSVDAQGIDGTSDQVYHLLRSNQAENLELEAPHLYAVHSLSAPRADARAVALSGRMVLVLGGLESAPNGVPALELYRWTAGGRAGFREGGTLEHLAVTAIEQAQVWDRGFAAMAIPCAGPDPCPLLLVGGQTTQHEASDRALILRLEQVDSAGQLSWQVVAESLGQPLPAPRWGASVSLLDDGSYLVAGGSTAPPGRGGELAQEAYLYLPYTE